MITIVLALCLGGLTFSTQEMPGLAVASVGPLTGKASCNFRVEDMDGDGNADVVLSDNVVAEEFECAAYAVTDDGAAEVAYVHLLCYVGAGEVNDDGFWIGYFVYAQAVGVGVYFE